MRLIDADAAYKMAKDDKRYPAFHYRKADLGDLYYLVLVDSPTIEAEPVRHGEYVLLYDTYGPMVCSECGGEAPSISMGSEYEESQYCPSCGAKMDGKEREE